MGLRPPAPTGHKTAGRRAKAKRAANRAAAGAHAQPYSAPGLAARRVAASILARIVTHRIPLDPLVDERSGATQFRALPAQDRNLVRAILGTALRRRGEIAAAIARRLDRPLEDKAGALPALLHVGAAQILFLNVPDHAAVSLAVSAAMADKRTRQARGLVNSVLRRIARERDEILRLADAGRLNTPDWLRQRWSDFYGEETAEAIAAAHLAIPPLDLTPRDSRPAGLAALAGELGGTVLPTGSIRLQSPGRITALPGFEAGRWWVQDAAAAMPARLLGPIDGKKVADLCAAPGGKTAQLAAAGANVTAVDISQNRLRRLVRNLARLRLAAQTVTADLLTWAPDDQFDAILLDAPCSATGTIRRHPDIAWLKTPHDIGTLADLQTRLIDRAVTWLRPGGRLVYCTCSLEAEEGEDQIASLFARNGDVERDPIAPQEVAGLTRCLTLNGDLRTLPCSAFETPGQPGISGMDGFFIARLRRLA
ncbi:MAG: 16S rRNA (cytosine(967)-C(5))-methyltransferase RsmB [Hyphomicrobiales bacterium]|nr:16S rRNA (cytosine(967)-C(5))-methyltransferase RsmB [Hyphomicrobiales bacterium]